MKNDGTNSAAQSPVVDRYQSREQHFSTLAQTHARAALRLSRLRLATGLLLCVALYQITVEGAGAIWLVSAVLLVGVFSLSVWRHRIQKHRERRYQSLTWVNAQAVYRVCRQWDKLTAPDVFPAASSRLCADLNLVGHASLLHLLNDLRSARGRRLLLDWLIAPAHERIIVERQQSVRALAPSLEHRQHLSMAFDASAAGAEHDEELIAWAEESPSPGSLPPSWLVVPLTAAGLLVLPAIAFGFVPPSVLFAVMAANLIVSFRYLPAIHQELDRLANGAAEFERYATLIDFVGSAKAGAQRLSTLQQALQSPDAGALESMRAARRIVGLADLRHAGLIYLFLQVVTLWSLHVYRRLAAWKQHAGPHVRRWLDAVAEYEVSAALAGVHYDNPDWCFPAVHAGANGFRAKALGHPLLPPAREVRNGVSFGQDHKPLLLVTGSNMSGKSTLLRSIGMNMLLAKTGSPVCATELEMPNPILATCFGSQDSLAEGVSSYMAELKCLKSASDQTRSAIGRGYAPFFLLDEILRGTNSHDRHTAATFILNQLIQAGAIGAVATHDLDLAEVPELKRHCIPVHFTDTLEQGSQGLVMHFDHLLRPGVARTSNALRLLQVAGLGMPGEDKEGTENSIRPSSVSS